MNRLEGVKFGLFDSCGRCIMSCKTDRCGEAIFENVPLGRYFVREIGGCPSDVQTKIDSAEVCLQSGCECKRIEFEGVRKIGAIKVIKTVREERCNFGCSECRQPVYQSCTCGKKTCPICSCNSGYNYNLGSGCGCGNLSYGCNTTSSNQYSGCSGCGNSLFGNLFGRR